MGPWGYLVALSNKGFNRQNLVSEPTFVWNRVLDWPFEGRFHGARRASLEGPIFRLLKGNWRVTRGLQTGQLLLKPSLEKGDTSLDVSNFKPGEILPGHREFQPGDILRPGEIPPCCGLRQKAAQVSKTKPRGVSKLQGGQEH